MKTNTLIAIVALSVATMVSCKKEAPARLISNDTGLVQMTFTASTIDTKTAIGALSEGKYPITWSENDQIKVIAVDGEGVTLSTTTFNIVGSGGSSSATFTGTTEASAAAYYAVYPASLTPTVSGTGDDATVSLSGFANHNVKAISGGIDASRAVMFAKAEGNNLTFNHGMTYFKLTVGAENISEIMLTLPDGGKYIYGNPTYKFSDGTTVSLSGTSASENYVILAPDSGTLTNGATYFIPVVSTNDKLGKITLTSKFNVEGKNKLYSSNVTTSKLKNEVTANGDVYDLGTPVVKTELSAVSSSRTWGESDFAAHYISYIPGNNSTNQGSYCIWNNIKYIGDRVEFYNGTVKLTGKGDGAGRGSIQFMVDSNGTVSIDCKSTAVGKQISLYVGGTSFSSKKTTLKGERETITFDTTTTISSATTISIASDNPAFDIYSITWAPVAP